MSIRRHLAYVDPNMRAFRKGRCKPTTLFHASSTRRFGMSNDLTFNSDPSIVPQWVDLKMI
jgi:hypothetical protein